MESQGNFVNSKKDSKQEKIETQKKTEASTQPQRGLSYSSEGKKPPRNPSKGNQGKYIAPIDHER